MKKTVTFLFSVILIMNYVNLAANDYIYSENENKANANNDLCEIKILMWNTGGFGWKNNTGIEITVDGVNYGIIKLPYDFNIYEGEETVLIPSGEVLFLWVGHFDTPLIGFEIYNTLGELIYTSPDYIPEGLFFTYPNECPHFVECLPITDLKGEYIPDIKQVNLTWTAPESTDLKGFDIYRNDELIDHLSPSTVSYSDNTAELEEENYKYCVIPVYPDECDLEDECIDNIYVGIITYSSILHLYPNPANNVVHISGTDVSNTKIFNNIGQLILTQDQKNTINVSNLPNGIYILSVETITKQITQKKLIINH